MPMPGWAILKLNIETSLNSKIIIKSRLKVINGRNYFTMGNMKKKSSPIII